MSVLEHIRRLAIQGRIIVSAHARQRMAERAVTDDDVRHALITATSARLQVDRGSYRVDGGVDVSGNDLTVIVALLDNVLVITISEGS